MYDVTVPLTWGSNSQKMKPPSPLDYGPLWEHEKNNPHRIKNLVWSNLIGRSLHCCGKRLGKSDATCLQLWGKRQK